MPSEPWLKEPSRKHHQYASEVFSYGLPLAFEEAASFLCLRLFSGLACIRYLAPRGFSNPVVCGFLSCFAHSNSWFSHMQKWVRIGDSSSVFNSKRNSKSNSEQCLGGTLTHLKKSSKHLQKRSNCRKVFFIVWVAMLLLCFFFFKSIISRKKCQ